MNNIVFLVGTPYKDAARTGDALSIEDFNMLDSVAKRVGVHAQIVLAVPDEKYAGTKDKPPMSVIKSYRPAVIKEILEYEPTAVIACGPLALHCLLNKGNVPVSEHLRETLVVPDLPNITCVVTHSVEQISVKQGMVKWLVLDTLAALHGRTKTKWGKYTVLQPGTPAWAKRPATLPKKLTHVGFDLETYPGLDPWHPNARIRMAVISDKPGRAWVVQLRRNSLFPKWLKTIVEDPNIVKAGSNIKFDYRWCARFGYKLRNMHDTSTAEHILDCTNPLTDLKSLAFLYLDRLGDYSKGHRSLVKERGDDWALVDDDEQYDYCGADGEASIAAALAQIRALVAEKLDRPFRLSMDLYEVLAEMETRGACVDLRTNEALDKKFEVGLNDLRDQITAVLGPINPNSPDQLAEALIRVVPTINLRKAQIQRQFSNGYYALKKNEDPEDFTTEREVLEREAHRHPIIETILVYRRYQKLHSTYVVGLRNKYAVQHPDGGHYVHTSYRTDVVETYRLSSQGPNLQNIPRKPEPDDDHPIPLELNIKRQYISRWASIGGKLLEADLSQAEVRWAAHLSQDQAMIDALLSGEDTHRELTARYLGKRPEDVTSLERTHGKRQTFLTLYGGGARTLAAQIGVSKARAKVMLDQYFATFSGLKAYIENTKLQVKRTLCSESLFGYRRKFTKPHNWMTYDGFRVERQAWNHQVQSGAAAYTFVAMIDLERAMRANGLKSIIVMQVHDSIVIDLYPGELDKVKSLVVRCLENADIERYGVDSLTVPMVADLAVGDNWGETESVEESA